MEYWQGGFGGSVLTIFRVGHALWHKHTISSQVPPIKYAADNFRLELKVQNLSGKKEWQKFWSETLTQIKV